MRAISVFVLDDLCLSWSSLPPKEAMVPVVSKVDMMVRLAWYERKGWWWKRGVAVYSVNGRSSGSFEAVLISDVGGALTPPQKAALGRNCQIKMSDPHPVHVETRTRLGDCRKLGSDSGRYRCAIQDAEDAPSDIHVQFSYQNSKPMQPRQTHIRRLISTAPRRSSPRSSRRAGIFVLRGESSSRAVPWPQSEGDLSCPRHQSKRERFHCRVVSLTHYP